jgi:hypothetical protein
VFLTIREIDGSLYDAMFISPHKFIGRHQATHSENVFISQRSSYDARRELHKVHKINKIEYSKDIEVRVVGNAQHSGNYKNRNGVNAEKTYQRIIENNESVLSNLVIKYSSFLKNRFNNTHNIFMVEYADNVKRMPILSR